MVIIKKACSLIIVSFFLFLLMSCLNNAFLESTWVSSAPPAVLNVTILRNGDTLTGSYDYNDPNGDLESGSIYRWLISSTENGTFIELSSDNTTSFSITIDEHFKYIKFEVIPCNNNKEGQGELALSDSLPVDGPPIEPGASGVSINGSPIVGNFITGIYQFSDLNGDAEAGTSFSWYLADTEGGTYTVINDQTDDMLILDTGHGGKWVRFEVDPQSVSPPNNTIRFASNVIEVGGPPTASGLGISGTPEISYQLTGSYNYTDPNGTDTETLSLFRWLSSDTESGTYNPIAGAVSINYTTVINDAGKWIKFEVTPSSNEEPYVGTPILSSAVEILAPPVALNVNITGVVLKGNMVTGNYNYYDANGDGESGSVYRWLRADTENGTYTTIPGATSTTYTLQDPADDQKWIKFGVIPRADSAPADGELVLSQPVEENSTPVAPVANNVSIGGTPHVGSTVSGSYTFSDPNGDLEATSLFRWLRYDDQACTIGETVIATSQSCLLDLADGGKWIMFEVTPVSIIVPTTGATVLSIEVEVEAPPVADSVTINGTVSSGGTLTGNYSYSDVNGDPEDSSHFRWLESNSESGTYTPISGETSTTLTLIPALENQWLKFEVIPVATNSPTDGVAVESNPLHAAYPIMAISPPLGTIDFGMIYITAPLDSADIEFTVINNGHGNLTGLSVSLNANTNYTISTALSATTLANTESATFTIRFDKVTSSGGYPTDNMTVSGNLLGDQSSTLMGKAVEGPYFTDGADYPFIGGIPYSTPSNIQINADMYIYDGTTYSYIAGTIYYLVTTQFGDRPDTTQCINGSSSNYFDTIHAEGSFSINETSSTNNYDISVPYNYTIDCYIWGIDENGHEIVWINIGWDTGDSISYPCFRFDNIELFEY